MMEAGEHGSRIWMFLREANCGSFVVGTNDAITDVQGVKVGHVTLSSTAASPASQAGVVRTGVTAVVPRPGNLHRNKVRAAVHVINGFGKAVGLWQVQELGEIETPILLTNTLSVATAADGILDYMLAQDKEIGVSRGTVNPIVLECNDGYLNDIRGRHVRREHVLEAIAMASSGMVEAGGVGAGAGMVSFGFKGGIGSSSRLVPTGVAAGVAGGSGAAGGSGVAEAAGPRYTVGCLVLANYGRPGELVVRGIPVGRLLRERRQAWLDEHMRVWGCGCDVFDEHRARSGAGSVIVVLATDAPLGRAALARMARRAGAGIARTGSYFAAGSGDFVVVFSTSADVGNVDTALMDSMFSATAEAVEAAVLNALFSARTTVGRDGRLVPSLTEFDADLEASLDKPLRELFLQEGVRQPSPGVV